MATLVGNHTTLANRATIDPKWFVIDATDVPVGRLAVVVSNILRGKHKPTYTPHTDTGDFVVVVNAEKVKFTGNKWNDKVYKSYSHYAGGQKLILGPQDARHQAEGNPLPGGEADDDQRPDGLQADHEDEAVRRPDSTTTRLNNPSNSRWRNAPFTPTP